MAKVAMLRIDKGVEMPRGRRQWHPVPWDRLVEGDSVFVPMPAGYDKKNEATKLMQVGRIRGWRIACRSEAAGIRIWAKERLSPAAAAAE